MSDPEMEEWERPSEWPNSWAATAKRLTPAHFGTTANNTCDKNA